MQIIKSEITGLIEQLLELQEKLKQELALYPEGRLTTRQSNGKFFIARHDEGKYRKKTVKDETTLRAMARKEYIEKVMPQIGVLLSELIQISNKFESLNTARVIETMKYAYKLLPQSYFDFSVAEPQSEMEAYLLRTRLWAAEPYVKSDYKPEERIHTTSQGEKVRSKSEVLSCEFYYQIGLGFRYEEVMYIENVQFAPDFKILFPDGSLFFHEHAGRMDSEEYRNRHIKKINQYNRFNIVPWQNLLVTYDRDGTINMEEIQNLIKGGVLSRIHALIS